jgi:hypothetical protein
VLLFEALATNNNGYILIVPTKIPDAAFDALGMSSMYLMLTFCNTVGITEKAVSAVIALEDGIAPLAVASKSRYYFAASLGSCSPVNAEYAVRRTFSKGEPAFAENQFSLLRYAVRDSGGFRPSASGAPVSFTECGSHGDDVLFRFALPAGALYGGVEYAAIGRTITAECQWLDIFGNLYGKSFPLSVTCGYKDSLAPLSAWPYIRFGFDIADQAVILTALPADYDIIPGDSLASVRDEYARIVRQLKDPNGVDVTFECPVLGIRGNVLLSEWAEKTAAYFQNGVSKPLLRCSYPITRTINDAGKLEIRAICASVSITRKGEAHKGFENVLNVKSVCSAIPAPDDAAMFAAAYEKALSGVRVLRDEGKLFEVRDIELKLGDTMVYAPPPFFNTLYSGPIAAYHYKPGEGLIEFAAVYTAADGNRMAANALNYVDAVFTANIIAAASLCGYPVENIERAKKEIAKALTQRLCRVEKNMSAAPCAEVQEAFFQRMLSQLTNYYSVRGMVSASAAVNHCREKARLYGSIRGECNALGLGFNVAKLNLNTGENRFPITISGAETLFDKEGAALPYTDINLCYEVTHIEDNIEEVVDGYVSSQWLCRAAGGTLAESYVPKPVRLPLPLLYFPKTPMFTGHKFVMDKDFTARYSVSYAKPHHYPHVEDRITVFYNPEPAHRAAGNALMDALAGFGHAGEDILKDLHRISGKILDDPTNAGIHLASLTVAMGAMLTLCENFKRALSVLSHPAPQKRRAGDTLSFRVSDGAENERYILTIDHHDVLPVISGYSAEKSGAAYVFKDAGGSYLTPARGQSIMERTFLLPPKKILSAWEATTEMDAKINGDLADAFVMRTDSVSVGSIARADFTADEVFDLHSRYGEESIAKAIKAFLQDIGGDLDVSCECRRTDTSGAEFPLFMQLPARNDPGALAAAWSGKIAEWLESVPKPIRQETRFAFRLNLDFGGVLKIPHAMIKA